MATHNLRGTIKVFDGFGYEQIAVGSVCAMGAGLMVGSDGKPLPAGTIINIYDGALELSELVAAPLLFQWSAEGFGLPGSGIGIIWGTSEETTLTIAAQVPRMKRGAVVYAISVDY